MNDKETIQIGSDEYFIDGKPISYALKLADDESLTADQVADSLKIGENESLKRLAVKRAVRLRRSDKEAVASYVIKNLSVMMFILLPIFAFILKVLYTRSRILYIQHLIHSLHLHSFAYLIYGIGLLLFNYVLDNGMINFLSFFIVSLYAYLSFLNVYRQRWFKTLVKFFMVGCIYSFLILVFYRGTADFGFIILKVYFDGNFKEQDRFRKNK